MPRIRYGPESCWDWAFNFAIPSRTRHRVDTGFRFQRLPPTSFQSGEAQEPPSGHRTGPGNDIQSTKIVQAYAVIASFIEVARSGRESPHEQQAPPPGPWPLRACIHLYSTSVLLAAGSDRTPARLNLATSPGITRPEIDGTAKNQPGGITRPRFRDRGGNAHFEAFSGGSPCNLLRRNATWPQKEGGGLSPDESRWVAGRIDYFLPVRVLSRVFRGKFLAGLRAAFQHGRLRFPRELATLARSDRFNALLSERLSGNFFLQFPVFERIRPLQRIRF